MPMKTLEENKVFQGIIFIIEETTSMKTFMKLQTPSSLMTSETRLRMLPQGADQELNSQVMSTHTHAHTHVHTHTHLLYVSTESEQPEKRPLRAAAVCLGLLSVLLLAGIIGLYLYYPLQTSYNNLIAERDQLQTSYNNLIEERDQLQTSYNNLTEERDQLQTSYNNLTEERDQLQTSYNNLTEERDQLQTSYNNLTEERDQLQRERDMLVWRRSGCPGGWRKFDSSCYFLSIVSKTWEESRQDCLNRGGDLVIIQSREEQVMSWIGLTDEDREGLWTWVDKAQLTTAEYWHPGEPNGGREENCGMIWMNYDAWNDASCSAALPWICEKYAYR
uniref:C-type lectin domain-containing protein n=1 Tax=Oncorhynchus mykiss TaxID=8022 RepID=A0A8C7SRB6_ONCMY